MRKTANPKHPAPGPLMSLDIEPGRTQRGRAAVAISFAIPAAAVVGLIALLISVRGGLEAAVASFARFLPLGYAFAAGMVASVNPCGVLMLPSYVFYQLDIDASPSINQHGKLIEPSVSVSALVRRLLKAFVVAVVVTAGFVVTFAIAGLVVAAGGRWLVAVFPYAGLVIGVAMIALGVWLLVARQTFGILAAKRVTLSPRRDLANMFLFGVAYAVGSLSCTLPIFLVVVGSGLASTGVLASLAQFVGYALGMGVVVVVVTIGTALLRQAAFRWMQRLTPYVHRLSAMFLIGAGLYLIYYWVFQAKLIF